MVSEDEVVLNIQDLLGPGSEWISLEVFSLMEEVSRGSVQDFQGTSSEWLNRGEVGRTSTLEGLVPQGETYSGLEGAILARGQGSLQDYRCPRLQQYQRDRRPSQEKVCGPL